MNHIGSSIKDQLDLASEKQTKNLRGAITFNGTGDFSPHQETFVGALPMVFSFEEVFPSLTGWVELKDGFFSLLPLVLKQKNLLGQIVFSDVARFFLPNGDFHYSRFQFDKISSEKKTCFVLLDFYQGLTSQDQLEKSFKRLTDLASKYEQIRLCVSVSGVSSKEPSQLFVLLNTLKQLPPNVAIIGNEELFGVKNFQGSEVHFLTDDDFVLKSPWENVFVTRGARIVRPKLGDQDQLILTVPLAPGVNKVVYKHLNNSCLVSEDILEHYMSFIEKINNPQDLIRGSALRQTRDFVKNVFRSEDENQT